MIFACEFCGGGLDPASHFILWTVIAAFVVRGWYTLIRVFKRCPKIKPRFPGRENDCIQRP